MLSSPALQRAGPGTPSVRYRNEHVHGCGSSCCILQAEKTHLPSARQSTCQTPLHPSFQPLPCSGGDVSCLLRCWLCHSVRGEGTPKGTCTPVGTLCCVKDHQGREGPEHILCGPPGHRCAQHYQVPGPARGPQMCLVLARPSSPSCRFRSLRNGREACNYTFAICPRD